MQNSLSFNPYQLNFAQNFSCDCQQAQRWCAPPFVFSISGQVGFRYALLHILKCKEKVCTSLRKKVIDATGTKLQWLFTEDAFLGCIHLQPYLYGVKKPLVSAKNFPHMGHHLAHCPHESCAKLRRSLLLTIRKKVNPTSQARIEED